MQGNPRQATLAYIAGIIDGEGTIRIHKSKPYIKTSIRIVRMLLELVLVWLRKEFLFFFKKSSVVVF